MPNDKIRKIAQRWMKRFHSDDTAEFGEDLEAILREELEPLLKAASYVTIVTPGGLRTEAIVQLAEVLKEWGR